MNERQQQLDLFTDAKEQRRAERLERVAQLATLPKVTTAARWFDDDGEREARAQAGEVVVVSRGYAGPDMCAAFDRQAPERAVRLAEDPQTTAGPWKPIG